MSVIVTVKNAPAKTKVMKMQEHKIDCCIHEELIQDNSLKIGKLEARADFKDQRLTNLEKDMKDVKKELEKVNESIINSQKETVELIKNLQIESSKDDYNIDKRVTSLETTVRVLKWTTTTLLVIIPILITLNIIR